MLEAALGHIPIRSRKVARVVVLACLAALVALSSCSAPAPSTQPEVSSEPELSTPQRSQPSKTSPPARTAIHVSTSGRDDARGTRTNPLRTIKTAIERSSAHGLIVVHSGIYHEELTISRREGITVEAAPGAEVWLDGASAVTRWFRQGSVWISPNWRSKFDHSPTFSWGKPDFKRPNWRFVSPSHPMAAHPDQLWIDGKRQEQVSSKSKVKSGTFFVDYATQRLYVGSNPVGRSVRASSIATAIAVQSAGTVIRGIGVRNYAPSVPHFGAVRIEAPDVTLDAVSVIRNATIGLHIMNSGARLRNMEVRENGMIGITANSAHGLQLDHVAVRQNNIERFNPAPSAGGVKIGRTIRVVIRNSIFADNFGNGLWFDDSSYEIDVIKSRSLANAGNGIFVEISGKADIVGNILANNAGNGVKINDASDVQLWNNTFVQNNRAINVVQDNRDLDPQGSYRDPSLPLPWQNVNIAIRNNIIAGSSGNCLVAVEDYSGRWTPAELNLTSVGNVYYRANSGSPGWLVIWARRAGDPYVFKTLTDFRKTTGQEEPGQFFTGDPVLDSKFVAKQVVKNLASTVAQPITSSLASHVGVPPGSKHLGAWID